MNLDLEKEDQLQHWLQSFRKREFQDQITGITLSQECGGKFKCPECNHSSELSCSHCGAKVNGTNCKMGVQHSLSKPIGFDEVFYIIERVEPNLEKKIKGNKKIICIAGKNKVVVTLHDNQPAARITLSQQKGVQRFNPYGA